MLTYGMCCGYRSYSHPQILKSITTGVRNKFSRDSLLQHREEFLNPVTASSSVGRCTNANRHACSAVCVECAVA